MKIAIDLCCGLGGWTNGLKAAGWHVIGFDIETSFTGKYKGDEFRVEDVRYVADHVFDSKSRFGLGHSLCDASLVVASPPCPEFTRHALPWTKKMNPPEPDQSIWRACERIARNIGCPIVLENVRAAQPWMGTAMAHAGPFYLWGDVPPLLPRIQVRKKESLSSTKRAERAMIPFDLALWIGQCFLNEVDRAKVPA